MANKAQLFILRKAIESGQFTKEQALQSSFQGMEQKVVSWIKKGKEITVDAIMEDIDSKSNATFMELMSEIEVTRENFIEMAEHFAKEETITEIKTKLEEMGSTKVGRNDPCPCGSGKKYKKCCGR